MTRGIVALVFRCKITGGQLTATDEATAFRWASRDRTSASWPTEAYAIRVLDALQPNAAPAVRHHDGTHLL